MTQVTIRPVNASDRDAQWCIQQYFNELAERFDTGFDPSLSNPALAEEMTPPNGLFLVAYLHNSPIGCAGLPCHENAPTEIKRMWVAKSARGLGLGRRLLSEVEAAARKLGTAVLHLETNDSLKEAINMYRQSGYQEVAPFNDEPYAHHWCPPLVRKTPHLISPLPLSPSPFSIPDCPSLRINSYFWVLSFTEHMCYNAPD